MTDVYRAPMRSRDDDVDHGRAVARALSLGVVGVGGRLPAAPVDLADAIDLVRHRHDDRMARRLARFAAVDTGAFVWTWTEGTGFRLGRIDGPWRHDGSAAARRVDLSHVRTCLWLEHEIPLAGVPTDVVSAFERGGRNFQRIRAERVGPASEEVWATRV